MFLIWFVLEIMKIDSELKEKVILFKYKINVCMYLSNFSNYKARFSMPHYETQESMFYSWEFGRVHFIAVNTEAYYYLNYGIKPLFTLHKWLKKDLEVRIKNY